ncbi:SH3 domain-containing protein [Roseobacter sp. HKCCA0434]|uniref:SH3 domain-containing protein n=1 Tax=Roseobacter sp. HKCCA0434 TaxID=3079297 RepID=UPI002905B351|nr:SH3 domain-containing protein [Roseobacter sp. HKCCA0434]
MRVIADWTASYADPIRLRAGEAVRLTGREDIWDRHRWLWAEAGERVGWVPDDLVARGRALRDYSALELTVKAGEEVEAGPAQHGWRWCSGARGEGWVPEWCLV